MDENYDKIYFPKQLVLHLVEDETGIPARNIAVTLHLFVRRKNDYDLGSPLSDDEGVVVITEDWVRRGIDYERNTFIMDYSSTMEDCLSQVRIKVMSEEEISKAMRAMRLYGISNGGPTIAHGIADLADARNRLYHPQEIYVDLNMPDISIKEIWMRLHSLK